MCKYLCFQVAEQGILGLVERGTSYTVAESMRE